MKYINFQISYLILFLLIFSSLILGQEGLNKTAINQSDVDKVVKFDEFGDVGEIEFAPKLKSFAEALKSNDFIQGYIVYYSSFNSTPFQKTAFYCQNKFKGYMKYLRKGNDGFRITFIRGGVREKPATELWLVPTGSEGPPIINSAESESDEKYKLEIIGTRSIDLSKAVLKSAKGKVSKSEKNDAEFLRPANEKGSIRGLAELLGGDKTWRGVIFFYADKDLYDIEKARQIVENQVKYYLNARKTALGRVKITYGGYRSDTEIESWIIPTDGIEPEAMPNEKIEEN